MGLSGRKLGRKPEFDVRQYQRIYDYVTFASGAAPDPYDHFRGDRLLEMQPLWMRSRSSLWPTRRVRAIAHHAEVSESALRALCQLPVAAAARSVTRQVY